MKRSHEESSWDFPFSQIKSRRTCIEDLLAFFPPLDPNKTEEEILKCFDIGKDIPDPQNTLNTMAMKILHGDYMGPPSPTEVFKPPLATFILETPVSTTTLMEPRPPEKIEILPVNSGKESPRKVREVKVDKEEEKEETSSEEEIETLQVPVKRGRGRPRKAKEEKVVEEEEEENEKEETSGEEEMEILPVKRRKESPRKVREEKIEEEEENETEETSGEEEILPVKRGRGRPRMVRGEEEDPHPLSENQRLLKYAKSNNYQRPTKLVKQLKTLKKLCKSKDPDIDDVIGIMEETLKCRRGVVNGQWDINEAIFFYPPLLLSGYLSHEYGLLYLDNPECDDFPGKVADILNEYVKKELGTEYERNDHSYLALKALQKDDSPEMKLIVGAILLVNKKSNNEANQTLYFDYKAPGKQLCFKINRNKKLWEKNHSMNIYLEEKPIGCRASNFYEALMCVYYYYWIFNLKYRDYARNIFEEFDFLMPPNSAWT